MLNEVETDDSVLLLYLADELPPASRAEVERRLAGEPALREELERLEAVQGAVSSWFERADAAAVPADEGGRGRSTAAAVRRVSRVFVERRLAVEETARAAAMAAKKDSMWPKSLLPRWAYPLTAAAAIVVGILSLVQWGGSLVGSSDHPGGGDEWGDTREQGGDGGRGGFSQRGWGGRSFSYGTFAIDEDDVAAMRLSVGAYDVSHMFDPDVN